MSTSISNPKLDKKGRQKKAHYISRADLDLPTYKAEQDSREPILLFRRGFNHLKTSTQFHVYVALQLIAAVVGYGQVMFAVGLLWAMLVNTGKRQEGEMSAYSLFNEGVESIAGTTDMEALEQELRTRGM